MLFSYSNRLLGRHESSGPNCQVCRAVGARSLVSMSKERRYEALSLLFNNSAFQNAMHRGTGGDSATWFYHMRLSRSRRGTLACGGSMSRAAHKRAQLAIGGGGQAGSAQPRLGPLPVCRSRAQSSTLPIAPVFVLCAASMIEQSVCANEAKSAS